MYVLKPAHEWATEGRDVHAEWKGVYGTREMSIAFAASYESREAAIEAAEVAGLFPVVESYHAGRTTIRVMPEGVRPPYAVTARGHGGGRLSGLYRQA